MDFKGTIPDDVINSVENKLVTMVRLAGGPSFAGVQTIKYTGLRRIHDCFPDIEKCADNIRAFAIHFEDGSYLTFKDNRFGNYHPNKSS